MPNETIHDEIEEWLAVPMTNTTSFPMKSAPRSSNTWWPAPSCHALQQEEKQMHQLLENTLATESADPAFEQRMVSRFRANILVLNGGLISFFTGLMRMRAS